MSYNINSSREDVKAEKPDNSNMLAECRLVLTGFDSTDFIYNKGSLLQGVLYEHIDSSYVAELHEQGMKPYSQSVIKEKDDIIWSIRTLSGDASDKILRQVASDDFSKFKVKHNNSDITIQKKTIVTTDVNDLFQKFYSEDSSRNFVIEFRSPTSFKKDGRYHFYPEIYNIYQSLMSRFDLVSAGKGMFSQETLEQLAENTEITGYNMKSVRYGLEGVAIPSFMGRFYLRINGPQTMVNFARMLFEFGNYSGVGIKTALGMGYIHVEERRKKAE